MSFGDANAQTQSPVSNPGFEIADTAQPSLPANWTVVGNKGRVAIDVSEKHGGERSVRIERDEQFTGLAQSIDAGPWRGKLIAVRAWLKGRDTGAGNVGVWLRGDGAGKLTFFSHSYAKPLEGADWQVREAIGLVPTDTERLVFGVAMATSGVLWADDIELVEHTSPTGLKISDTARAYLTEAIEKIRANALNADAPDWDKLVPVLRAIVDGATTTTDTYPAIEAALSALRDNHSYFRSPQAMRQLAENKTTSNFGIQSRTIGAIGYVAVPGFEGGAPSRRTAFADELQARLNAVSETGPCAWIVDLRSNTGGNMWPMLAGLAPLIGDGDVGKFVSSKHSSTWRLAAGAAGVVDGFGVFRSLAAPTQHRALAGAERTPIAVLIGPQTSSSGEATLVSFIGRQRTRTFGEPTAGRSTANEGFTLSDGAMMLITTAKFVDRNGRIYGGKIQPEQFVASTSAVELERDPVVAAAIDWLRTQIECSGRS